MEMIIYEQIARLVFLKYKDLSPQEQRKLATEKTINEIKKKVNH